MLQETGCFAWLMQREYRSGHLAWTPRFSINKHGFQAINLEAE
jgi:hypothetical protein